MYLNIKGIPTTTTVVSQGLRVTDQPTIEIAQMVLGALNKRISSNLKRAGGRAIGISGMDDNLLLVKKLIR